MIVGGRVAGASLAVPVDITPGSDTPLLPPVQTATLVLCGTDDRYLTERATVASERYVQGPWRYERIDDAGHWLQLDQPERVNELLLTSSADQGSGAVDAQG